jgi:hypothetical protein
MTQQNHRKTRKQPNKNPETSKKYRKHKTKTKYGAKLELTSRIRPLGTRVDRPRGGAAAFNK